MVGPCAGTPMTVPCTLVFPFWRNTESVVVPRVVVAGDAVDVRERLQDGVGVAADDGQVGEVGLGVEVVERRVEVVHRRLESHEHGDACRDEDRGEDEAEAVTRLMLQSRARVPGWAQPVADRASATIATMALRTSSPVVHSSANASRTGVRCSALTATMSKP